MSRKKLFIDCGYHLGEGLEHFTRLLGIDQTWIVITFEANPECRMNERLVFMKWPQGRPDLFPLERAVWIYDGMVNFSQENHRESGSGSPTDDTSDIDGWASSITEVNMRWLGMQKPIKVPCTDLSRMLEIKWIKECDIYCKMDIEGSEFPVLRKMISDGTIKYIKKMWIEFHEQFLPNETEQTRSLLIRELCKHTEVEVWH